MTKALFCQAILKFALGVLALGLLLFGSAGTLRYWQGWLLMGILFIPMFCAGLVMIVKNPDLLKKRLSMKERQAEQAQVIRWSGAMFLLGFALAGLGVRLGWPVLPRWVSWAGAAVFLLSYLLYAEVLRENAYLSRTVEVQEGQKLIETGLYAVVRHPMYSATVLLFLSMPLVLGSLPAFVVFLVYPAILVKRVRNEEEVLEAGLAGYTEYKQRVKYRLIPHVW